MRGYHRIRYLNKCLFPLDAHVNPFNRYLMNLHFNYLLQFIQFI